MYAAASFLAVPDPYDVTPGLLGFAVVFAIGLATWLLLRSFIRHLARIKVPHDERRPAGRRGPGSSGPPGT